MKILLACLMCLVLTVSQAYAIKGGPFDGGGGQVTVTGTYAGVLVSLPPVLDEGPPVVLGDPDNSLALFTFRIPRVGLATGESAVFRNGFFYPGQVVGSADPDSAKVTAILNAVFEVTDVELADGSKSITARYNANGKFDKATIKANDFSVARIRGKASLTYTFVCTGCAPDPAGDSGGPIFYKIRGFKQSEATI